MLDINRSYPQNPLVFAAGFVAGIVFSIDQSVCCCVDTGIKSAKLATLAKLLLTVSIVALLTGGIASGYPVQFNKKVKFILQEWHLVETWTLPLQLLLLEQCLPLLQHLLQHHCIQQL